MTEQERECWIVWALRKFRHHPEYDDLLQEARIDVWKLLSRQQVPPAAEPTLIERRARWTAMHYLRTGKGGLFTAAPRRRTHPEPLLSLDYLPMQGWPGREAEEGEGFLPGEAWLKVPDFAPEAAARFDDQAVWEELRQQTPAREWQVLEQYYGNGRSFRQIGADLSLSEGRTNQLRDQAFNRYRETHGLPIRGWYRGRVWR